MSLIEGVIDKESIKNVLIEYLTENGNGAPSSSSNEAGVLTSQEPQNEGVIAAKMSNNVKGSNNVVDVRLDALEKILDIRFEAVERRVTFLENMITAMSSD